MITNVDNLKHYMFTNKRIMAHKETVKNDENAFLLKLNNKNSESNIAGSNVKPSISKLKDGITVNKESFFCPRESDKLFWCYFIAKNGMFEYEILNHSTFVAEKRCKIELVEKIRNNKDILKIHKWKLTQLEENLVSNKAMSLKTFMACCLLDDLNIIVKKNMCVYNQNYNKKTDPNIICLEDGGFSIYQYDDGKKIVAERFLEENYIIENINKAIYPIANYKIGELQEICGKLKINIKKPDGKKFKKTELYEMIKSKI